MTGLNRVVVLSLGLSAASAGLAMRAASPSLHLLRAEYAQAEQRVRLLNRIVTNADRFDTALDPSDDRSQTGDTQWGGEIRQAVNDFRQAAAGLRDRVGGGHVRALDVEEVLRCGAGIDSLARRHQLSAQAEEAWLSLRADLGMLARTHSVAWNRGAVQATAPAATEDQP